MAVDGRPSAGQARDNREDIMARIHPIPRERMTPEQVRAFEATATGGPRAPDRGPHSVWLHTPEVLARVNPLLTYLRNEAPVPLRLSTLAILVTARAWTAQYAWASHEKRALAGGLDPAVIDAIKHRRTPDFANEDEAAVYTLAHELLEARAVSDATYARAAAALGETTLMYVVNIIGCYLMVAAVLTTFRVDVPDGIAPPLAP
jgi:4-carboxymuconolactone decarboxylase